MNAIRHSQVKLFAMSESSAPSREITPQLVEHGRRHQQDDDADQRPPPLFAQPVPRAGQRGDHEPVRGEQQVVPEEIPVRDEIVSLGKQRPQRATSFTLSGTPSAKIQSPGRICG